MVHAIRYAGKVYQNDLAAMRLKALGYKIAEEHDKRGATSAGKSMGFPRKSVTNSHSEGGKSTRASKASEKDHGRAPNSAEVGIITRDTREKKAKHQTAEGSGITAGQN